MYARTYFPPSYFSRAYWPGPTRSIELAYVEIADQPQGALLIDDFGYQLLSPTLPGASMELKNAELALVAPALSGGSVELQDAELLSLASKLKHSTVEMSDEQLL